MGAYVGTRHPSTGGTDCWINDVPKFSPFASSQPQPSQHEDGRTAGNSDFDPFNDDLLSDSEHGDGGISPFPFPKRDSI
jgi:hypothetical protein